MYDRVPYSLYIITLYVIPNVYLFNRLDPTQLPID
jgi:hypothetical protein